nr:MAG TPA: DHFR protein [Caudoviricetes sp.]
MFIKKPRKFSVKGLFQVKGLDLPLVMYNNIANSLTKFISLIETDKASFVLRGEADKDIEYSSVTKDDTEKLNVRKVLLTTVIEYYHVGKTLSDRMYYRIIVENLHLNKVIKGRISKVNVEVNGYKETFSFTEEQILSLAPIIDKFLILSHQTLEKGINQEKQEHLNRFMKALNDRELRRSKRVSCCGIVAITNGKYIGINGKLPVNCKEDLAFFKKMTEGNIVIMGRNTWGSLPDAYKPLPNRINVVLSNQDRPNGLDSKVQWLGTKALDLKALQASYPDKKIFFIGGANVFDQFHPYIDTFYLTFIETTTPLKVKETDEVVSYNHDWVRFLRKSKAIEKGSSDTYRYSIIEHH